MFLPAFVKLSYFATGFACFLAGVAIICASSASPEPLVLNNPSAQPCVMGLGRTLLVFVRCSWFSILFVSFLVGLPGFVCVCGCFSLCILLACAFVCFLCLALLSFARSPVAPTSAWQGTPRATWGTKIPALAFRGHLTSTLHVLAYCWRLITCSFLPVCFLRSFLQICG